MIYGHQVFNLYELEISSLRIHIHYTEDQEGEGYNLKTFEFSHVFTF